MGRPFQTVKEPLARERLKRFSRGEAVAADRR